jgi:hypothetical protein
MPQARLTGRSVPKVVRVNADDDKACLYKNLGNGRRVPFIWGDTVTLASGTTEVVVASGVSFNNFTPETGVIQVTPVFTVTSGVVYDTTVLGKVYIEKDVGNKTLKLKSTVSAGADTDFDVVIFLGDDATFTSNSSNQIWKRRDQSSM